MGAHALAATEVVCPIGSLSSVLLSRCRFALAVGTQQPSAHAPAVRRACACRAAYLILLPSISGSAAELEVRDITSRPEWEAKFAMTIPVLAAAAADGSSEVRVHRLQAAGSPWLCGRASICCTLCSGTSSSCHGARKRCTNAKCS